MQLNNVDIIGMAGKKNILINGDKISSILPASNDFSFLKGDLSLSFENAIAFPGLINSHDHLDFNLFPQLGNKKYNNYTEWGNDIHTQNKKEINSILKIPKHLRTQWGIYKNLLNGITTVVNHGEKLVVTNDLISVFQEYYPLHSVTFEKWWKFKLNNPFKKRRKIVMHVGEGIDTFSSKEIDQLIKWNLLKKEIIGVHGVALNEKQAPFFRALVWCPATNYFLLGKTAEIKSLKNKMNILFGTDSTLTASWNLWEHLRLAKKEEAATQNEIFNMLTINACAAWNLNNIGEIAQGKQADIVIANKKNNVKSIDAFYDLNPKDLLLVVQKGQIKLFDETLCSQFNDSGFNWYDKVLVQNSVKYVFGTINALINDIKKYNPNIQLPINPFVESDVLV